MVNVRGAPPVDIRESKRLRINAKRDWEQIRIQTAHALEVGEPISMQQLAKNLKVNASSLSQHIGSIGSQIQERAQAARAALRNKRLEDTTEQVKKVCDSLRAERKSVSARSIGKAVGRSPDTPYMRKAIKLVRMQELAAAPT